MKHQQSPQILQLTPGTAIHTISGQGPLQQPHGPILTAASLFAVMAAAPSADIGQIWHVFGHLKRLGPSWMVRKRVPIAAICRYRKYLARIWTPKPA